MFQKVERNSTEGFHLYDFGSHWEFHSSRGIFKGNFKQVCTHAVIEYGFPVEELEVGALEMNKHFHNGAVYGIFKSFMYTFDKQKNYLQ